MALDATHVGTIQITNEAASLKRIIGYFTVDSIAAAGTSEDTVLDTGLDSCKYITFSPRFVATNPINCTLQDDTTLPMDGNAVTIQLENDGIVYYEALGTGSRT